MKKSLKILTAITSFFPAVFFAFGVILSATNMFMSVKAATAPMPSDGATAELNHAVLFAITFAILPIIMVLVYAFNYIFDIVYIVRSGKFNSNQTALWIALILLFGTVTAPIFWCVYLRPLSPDEPMFPPKETVQY